MPNQSASPFTDGTRSCFKLQRQRIKISSQIPQTPLPASIAYEPFRCCLRTAGSRTTVSRRASDLHRIPLPHELGVCRSTNSLPAKSYAPGFAEPTPSHQRTTSHNSPPRADNHESDRCAKPLHHPSPAPPEHRNAGTPERDGRLLSPQESNHSTSGKFPPAHSARPSRAADQSHR